MKEINKVQEKIFELMEMASFNEFDGAKVVKDLKENRKLWEGVVMDRGGYYKEIDLIKLRDIGDGYWNVDTLFILPVKGKEKELEKLARHWNADEIDWIDEKTAGKLMGCSYDRKILRVWWD